MAKSTYSVGKWLAPKLPTWAKGNGAIAQLCKGNTKSKWIGKVLYAEEQGSEAVTELQAHVRSCLMNGIALD